MVLIKNTRKQRIANSIYVYYEMLERSSKNTYEEASLSFIMMLLVGEYTPTDFS
jgi:hypothetical protein